jgi:hypothetical protein
MLDQWYYLSDGRQAGPVSCGELGQLAASGALQPADLVWKAGMGDWSSVGSVEGVFPRAVPVEPPVAARAAEDASAVIPDKATTAGATGFLATAKASWDTLSGQQKAMSAGLAGLVVVGGLLAAVLSGGKADSKRESVKQDVPDSQRSPSGYHAMYSPVAAQQSHHHGGGVRTGATPTPSPASAAIDQRLVGTWVLRNSSTIRTVDDVFVLVSYHYLTITADGRYADRSQTAGSQDSWTGTASGGVQGRVAQQGNVLVFTPDNGQAWRATYQLGGTNGLRLNGGEWYEKR